MSKSYSGYISAGGKGTRLLPVTSKIPKPLVMIHNKTLIELWVEQFSENQITDLYVSVEHMKEQIIEHLEELKQKYRINITYIIEDEPMGTGGSIYKVLEDYQDCENLIIVMADVVCKGVVSDMKKKFDMINSDLMLVNRTVEIQVPFGVISESNRDEFILEKPIERYLINSGLYVINRKIKKYFVPNKPIGLPDIVNKVHDEQDVETMNIDHLAWFDVGNPDDLHKVRNLF
tara:strand:+ start:1093 stop:1788 length:696 start_codon:yes stop_codon:yes gene_type:complete